MSQYQSFFISASGNSSQCDEINHFLRSHVVIRTVENIINSGSNCGIQILVEYKDVQYNRGLSLIFNSQSPTLTIPQKYVILKL